MENGKCIDKKMRKIHFQNSEYYHIYNRGVDKRDIFVDNKDFIRFLTSMREFNQTEPVGSLYRLGQIRAAKPLRSAQADRRGLAASVEFICYCLNQNHFHFMLKQLTDKGIEKFMHKLGGGYTTYFNKKYNRSGSLFQGTFKAISAKKYGYMLWLSAYINGNPEIHKISKAKNWMWSSYQDYLDLRNGTLCNKAVILDEFKNDLKNYKKFVKEVIKESKSNKEMKKYLLESE